ncbi:expressed unknown protein [Seminavis robusta]|uniref:Uncharacterized protein n=1 Tax=Seminavis robusta TaxID=568900 RepID=A0A9N8EJF3_9STRA|nr:expressed unknown protein [Seminavis robusta]|eukprot:Sro1277_g258640.1 n/a (481) ;mRNA; r:5326-6768
MKISSPKTLALVPLSLLAASSAHAQERFAITQNTYTINDKERLANACHTELGLNAHVVDLDQDVSTRLQWNTVAPLFDGMQRFTHYWALGDSDYLDRLSSSRGVVVEYLWGDHVEPVLMGDAEMPSFLEVQVLCQITAADTDSSSSRKAPSKILTASSFGHWHVQTWAGDTLDFHNTAGSGATCNVILVDSPHFMGGVGLHIQVRLQSTPMWSYMDAAVIQIGEETLEVQGKAKGNNNNINNPYWINGVYQESNLQVSSFPIEFQQLNARQRDFKIDLGQGNMVSIRSFHQYVRVDVQTRDDSDMMEGSFGLLGSFPDGQWIGKDYQTMVEDANDYGKEWMVDQARNSLFQSSSVGPHNSCKFQVVSTATKKKARAQQKREQETSLASRLQSFRRRLTQQVDPKDDQSPEFLSKDASTVTTEDAQKACATVHESHPERIPLCIDGLMELIRNKKHAGNEEEGVFADVFDALFVHSNGEAN